MSNAAWLRSATLLLPVAALLLWASPAGAQGGAPAAPAGTRPVPVSHEVFAGEELERYLRTLQNVGRAGASPWSVRGLAPPAVRRIAPADRAHPWAGRYRFDGGDAPGGDAGLEIGWIRPRARAVYNSAFPFGGNDGPLWAGRGLTAALRAGGYLRYGPLTLVVAPVAFRAENAGFELAPVPGGGDARYRNPLAPGNIDLPQRFGPDPHARLDPGSSTLRLDAFGVSLGVSTAAQAWGPMGTHPLMLGPNAGGFPHVFLGTERPVDIWIGELHGRYMAGRLEESEFAPESPLEPVRAAPGFVVAFLPRGLEGLEVGLTRFIHREWPEEGIGASELFQPLETLFKENIPDADTRFADNQLLSAYARWNVPEAGVEVFGEFIREDHAVNSRVLVLEPDDLSGYALGFRRVWEGGASSLTVLRGEMLRTVSTHRQRGGARLQLAERAYHMYRHGRVRQGHTHRGQLLASPAGQGGEASILGLDRYHPGGRWSAEIERRVVRDRTAGPVGDDPDDVDVRYVAGWEMVRFTGRVDVEVGIRGVYELNRHLGDDRFNLSLRAGGTVRLP